MKRAPAIKRLEIANKSEVAPTSGTGFTLRAGPRARPWTLSPNPPYSIVNALTVNLPAIQRVQILVDGKEVDTLAGHVDLRHPLAKSLEWVVHDSQ